MTEAELTERDAAIAAGKRVVDYLNSRRKAGKGFEYEVRGPGPANGKRKNGRLEVLLVGSCRAMGLAGLPGCIAGQSGW
jgi:hypothetical protein